MHFIIVAVQDELVFSPFTTPLSLLGLSAKS